MDHMEFSIALPIDASTTKAGFEWAGMKERLLAHLRHSSGGATGLTVHGADGSFLARVAGQQVQDITNECGMGVEEAGRFVHALYLLENRCVPFLFILYNRFRFFTCRQKVPTAESASWNLGNNGADCFTSNAKLSVSHSTVFPNNLTQDSAYNHRNIDINFSKQLASNCFSSSENFSDISLVESHSPNTSGSHTVPFYSSHSPVNPNNLPTADADQLYDECSFGNLQGHTNISSLTSPHSPVLLTLLERPTQGMQEPVAQSFDSFLVELQMWAQNCEFGDLRDILLKDCIITGIHDDAARHCLLRTEGLDLCKTLHICRAVERLHKVRDSSTETDNCQLGLKQDASVMTDCAAQVCSKHMKANNLRCDTEESNLPEGIFNAVHESFNLYRGSHMLVSGFDGSVNVSEQANPDVWNHISDVLNTNIKTKDAMVDTYDLKELRQGKQCTDVFVGSNSHMSAELDMKEAEVETNGLGLESEKNKVQDGEVINSASYQGHHGEIISMRCHGDTDVSCKRHNSKDTLDSVLHKTCEVSLQAKSNLDLDQVDTKLIGNLVQSGLESVKYSRAQMGKQFFSETSGNWQLPQSEQGTRMATNDWGIIRQGQDGTLAGKECTMTLRRSKRRVNSPSSQNNSSLSQTKCLGINNQDMNDVSSSNCFPYSHLDERDTNEDNDPSYVQPCKMITMPQRGLKSVEIGVSKSTCEDQERNSEFTNLLDGKAIDTKQIAPPKMRASRCKVKMKKEQNQLHKCHVCYAQFNNRSHLQVHLRIHSGERPFSCSICGAAFSEQSKLKNHQRRHTGEKPYTCTTCNKTFSWGAAYSRHLRIHTGERPFMCEYCGISFTNSTALNRHVRVHTREKPYSCHDHVKSFSDTSRLKLHCQSTQHSTDDITTVDISGNKEGKSCKDPNNTILRSKDTSSSQIKINKNRGGNSYQQRPYICNTCGAAFRRSSHLQEHVRLHTGDRPHTCEVCGVKFSEASKLKAHRRRHTGERPYMCQICGATFSWTAALARHKRTHTLEKPYSCSTCGKTFADHSTLTRHARIHTGERPFPCTECHQTFADSSSLRRHQRTHSAEKPYTCEICGAGFSVKGYLVRHSRIHSGNRPYTCETCGAKFMDNSKLKRHAKVHTPSARNLKPGTTLRTVSDPGSVSSTNENLILASLCVSGSKSDRPLQVSEIPDLSTCGIVKNIQVEDLSFQETFS